LEPELISKLRLDCELDYLLLESITLCIWRKGDEKHKPEYIIISIISHRNTQIRKEKEFEIEYEYKFVIWYFLESDYWM